MGGLCILLKCCCGLLLYVCRSGAGVGLFVCLLALFAGLVVSFSCIKSPKEPSPNRKYEVPRVSMTLEKWGHYPTFWGH